MIKTFNHFYHVGPSENLRNAMTEALVIKTGYANETNIKEKFHEPEVYQLNFDFEPVKIYMSKQNYVSLRI